MVRFYLRFTGRVQGVGFRFFVAMNAERCHLTGWVKNMSDGSVTAEVQGTRVEIEKFLNLIQTGNRFVRVDEIEKEERPYEENEKRFRKNYQFGFVHCNAFLLLFAVCFSGRPKRRRCDTENK